MSGIKFLNHYGYIRQPPEIGAIPSDFTLNTPIGIASDQNGRVWVCDTGNNQIVIFDSALENIIDVITETDGIDLFLPFHLAPHPEKRKMYLTDMGNKRVAIFNYGDTKKGKYATYESSFSHTDSEPNTLQDPNGITLVKENDQFMVYVTDEFFHTKGEPLKNRCVKFDENGKFISQFKAVTDEYGKCYPLKWPQGLSSDSEGNLYLANTGYYEVLKICPKDEISKDEFLKLNAEQGSPFVHSFGNPKGSGYTNIIRGVNIIDDLAFIPDQVANKISVYNTKSNQLVCMIDSMTPTFSTLVNSLSNVELPSDLIYSQAENVSFISPYGICAGKEDGIYFITEPTVSCVLKIEMSISKPKHYGTCDKKVKPKLLARVGSRRTKKVYENKSDKCAKSSQFNVVTAVTGIKQEIEPQNSSETSKLPGYVRDNPFLSKSVSESLNMQYRSMYDIWLKLFCERSSKTISGSLYNIGAGNWTIKAYKACEDNPNEFVQRPQSFFSKYFVPLGSVGIATYYPKTPMFGQICPGTPLIFITNFQFGFASICQFDLHGQLVYYGLPFGLNGECESSLHGPQGLAINQSTGEIYIANSMSHCISKWQILSTGFIIFIKTFGRDEIRNFMPTDVAIDKDNRIFACDQLNNKIYVFSAEGELLCKYGQTGYWRDNEKGAADKVKNFQLPTSVCVDDDKLIVNDLVNRAIKIFTIKGNELEYYAGKSLFDVRKGQGGTWMPYLMYVEKGKIYVPDCAYNIVNVYEYN